MFFPINKKQMALSFTIGCVSHLADQNSKTNDLASAICDNLAHALIGTLTYIGAYVSRTSNPDICFFLEFLLCAIFSSAIDLDHFVAAKSFHLKEATSLKSRPLMHCTTLAIFIFSLVLISSHVFNSAWMCKFGWILATAFISHHIRDSKRRGFWLWPFGHTIPTPTLLCFLAQMFLPQILSVIIPKFSLLGVLKDFRAAVETV